MLFELMTLIILALAITLIFKLHGGLTATAKTIVVIVLVLLAYVAFMNLVSYKTYDITTVEGIVKATKFHVGGLFETIAGLWPEGESSSTGRVIEEQEGNERETDQK